jgi:hypothetical protein
MHETKRNIAIPIRLFDYLRRPLSLSARPRSGIAGVWIKLTTLYSVLLDLILNRVMLIGPAGVLNPDVYGVLRTYYAVGSYGACYPSVSTCF